MDLGQLTVPARQTGDSEGDSALVSAKHLGEVTKEITSGFVESLRGLQSLDSESACSLIIPARIVLLLGTFVIFTSFVLRCVPSFLKLFEFADFIASLTCGCLLIAAGVFLFCFQYRMEQRRGTETVKAVERVVAGGLVATLGPVPQSTPPAPASKPANFAL